MYFNGEPLFEAGWKDIPKWEKENPYMQDDLIRFVGACCMQLVEENRMLLNRIEELEGKKKAVKKNLNEQGLKKKLFLAIGHKNS